MELKTRVEKEFLPFVTKPLRYLGNEYNIITKESRQIDLRIALCFPDLYESGIRSVSFEVLYHFLNSHAKIWAERFYAPWTDAESLMRENDIPLFSLESKTALSEFDLVGFYLPDKLTFTNFLNMLNQGGIPLRSMERPTGKPLVIGGGPALNNPEPLGMFLDVVVPGDAEQPFWEAAETLMQAGNEGWGKTEILRKLAQLPGMYVPSFYEPVCNDFGEFQGIRKLEPSAADRVQKMDAGDAEEKWYSIKPLVPLTDTTFARPTFDSFERFSGEQGDFTPGRLSEPMLQRRIENLYEETQKFLSSNSNDPANALLESDRSLSELSWILFKEKVSPAEQDIKISLPSGKLAFRFPASDGLLNEFKANEFTLSPHAGSQRLRNVLNVNAREQELLDALKAALSSGWQHIRLNFTIGLPTEKNEDIVAIADLVKKCLHAAGVHPDAQFHVCVQAFSPKAHTPFQWEKQESPAVLTEKFSLLQEGLAGSPVKLTFQNPHITSLETALSRGDRRMGAVIENAWRLGARFDALKETFREDYWAQAFRESGISWEDCLSSISITLALPWDHIDIGVSKAYLKEEKLRASQGQIHPQNKDLVSIGYGGIRRDRFGKLLQGGVSGNRGGAGGSAGISSQLRASAGTDAIQYGRRGRKRQTPVAVIKRKIRIRYSKSGLARFLSHLDVVRVFDRSAQLAKIPLVYSQGLRPNPKISYGPPLSPGIASTAEYLDMEVEIGRETDIQGRFNEYLPAGMQILQFQGIFAKVPALAAVINRLTYEALFSDEVSSEELLQTWLEQTEARVKRPTKDGVKDIDIRPFVHEMKCANNKLLISIDINEGKTTKVTEVLESLLAPQGVDYRKFPIQRTGQYIVKDDSVLTPFDIL